MASDKPLQREASARRLSPARATLPPPAMRPRAAAALVGDPRRGPLPRRLRRGAAAGARARAPSLPLGSLVGDVVVAPTASADARFGALASPLDAVLVPLALDLSGEWPPRWAACNRAGAGDALVSVHATFAYAPPAPRSPSRWRPRGTTTLG